MKIGVWSRIYFVSDSVIVFIFHCIFICAGPPVYQVGHLGVLLLLSDYIESVLVDEEWNMSGEMEF